MLKKIERSWGFYHVDHNGVKQGVCKTFNNERECVQVCYYKNGLTDGWLATINTRSIFLSYYKESEAIVEFFIEKT